MIKSAYPFSFQTAISTAALLSLLVLSACGGSGKKDTIHISQQQQVDKKAAEEAKVLAQRHQGELQPIQQLVLQAQLENPETIALEQLLITSQNPSLTQQSQGQAALQYAELLFEFERPDAFQVNKETIEQWSNHPYLPQAHLTVAEQWVLLENYEEAMVELTLALHQPHVEADILANNTDMAQPLLEQVAQQTSLEWVLAISQHDAENRDYWLKQAAKSASLEYVLQLRQSDHPLTEEQTDFYRYAARERLMVGDYHAVRVISKILTIDMPDSQAREIVQLWAENEGERTVIGVLLPLTGKYAAYGQQALQGIRLALSRTEFEDSIVLRIQDTTGDAEQAVSAYHQLLSKGSEWVIGPLLSSNTQALLPYLTDSTPIISLSNKTQLASESPALFVHSLAKTVQADFMARQAIKQGTMRIAILHGYTKSETEEAAAFAQTFMDAGGEIVDVIALEYGISDNRPDLVHMRSNTDDEELLATLDDDLYLFSVEQDMDIKMPLNFDAIYIAAPGKKVSILAGQMAYADIRNIKLYGSYRWFDGHLMDDDGRYLSRAQFASPTTTVSQPNQAVLDVKSQFRIIWEKEDITPLFALAYDAAMNIASLGSRLGLKGRDAIDVLLSGASFPAISGTYYFDMHGVSQKTFALQGFRRGRIETIQAAK